MPGPVFGGDTSSYKTRPIQSRIDADGKEWIYARVHGTLTAKVPYVARITYDGWRTLALFDTGVASTSAASHGQYVAFIPDYAISSDTDGWGQCGGVCTSAVLSNASQSTTTGNVMIWSDATVTGTGAASATVHAMNVYAISMTTQTAGYNDIMLLGSGRFIFGTT